MTQMQVAQRMTAEQFLALPEQPDGPRLELVEGAVVVNEPLPRHASAQLRLLFALESWVRAETGRGTVWVPLDIRLDERNVFAPDVLWYPSGSEPGLDQFPSPLPDLAVEIRSPSTWRYDIGVKKAAYERHGLPELWLVDTAARAVLVFRRSQRDEQGFDVALELDEARALDSPLLRGFSLPLGAILRDER